MNNHPFLKSIQSSDGSLPLCAFCGHTESSHPQFIECQVCSHTDYCSMYMTLMMCNSCRDNEIKLQSISQQQAAARVEESIKQHDNVTEVIRYSSEFYNANVISLEELRKSINNDEEFCCAIQARIEHLTSVLRPAARQTLSDVESEIAISQRLLNTTVSTLQREIREKFKSANINYTPSTEKKVKLPSIKSRDPVDRLVAIYIQQMEKRGTPIEPKFQTWKNGELLYDGKDHSIATIRANESGGIVKTITAFERAKQIISSSSTDEQE